MMAGHNVAVILAAGSSRRFGGDKRLANVYGVPMLQRSLAAYTACDITVCVVLRPNDPITDLVPEGVRVIEAADADFGMGHSLAAAAVQLNSVERLLVGLADMPWVKTSTVELVLAHIDAKDVIVRPSFQNQLGHPVGFAGRYLNDMKALRGDVGARELLKKHARNLRRVAVDDPGVLLDVDFRENLDS
ncbi:MAG: nucleotidyltransferase family protein [Gammaproteobacteria bacterium]|nr:nucleotidyltransferase family protein [Gammaproteobacteria bacterium]